MENACAIIEIIASLTHSGKLRRQALSAIGLFVKCSPDLQIFVLQ